MAISTNHTLVPVSYSLLALYSRHALYWSAGLVVWTPLQLAIEAMKPELADSERHHATADSSADLSPISAHEAVIGSVDSPCVVMETPYYQSHRPSLPLAHSRGTRPRVLSFWALFAISFLTICGGPIGSEEIVVAAGPLPGLIAILVFPTIFFLPIASMVVELASAIPASGGHAYWIALAFGPSWGFQAGYWSWVSNCIDCALYASMSVSSLLGPTTRLERSFVLFACKATLALVLAIPGLWSLRAVGVVVALLSGFVGIPYIVLSTWGAIEADQWGTLLEIRRANITEIEVSNGTSEVVSSGPFAVDYCMLIQVLVWSYSGFYNLSVFIEQVKDPIRSFRRTMWLSYVVFPAAFFIPFATMLAVNKPHWSTWEEGSMGDVALSVGSDVLAGLIKGIDLLSSAGLYICGLTASAYLANGMAHQGIAPTTIGLSTSHGTPHGAIFCSLAVILVIINLEYDEMVMLANGLGGFEAIAFIAASVRLRYKLPDVERPYKHCGNAHPIVPTATLVLPLAMYIVVILDAFHTLTSAVLVTVFVIIGVVYTKQADFSKFQTLDLGDPV
ncbi:hypothetical protein ATCC90586_000953 [Pythium insidiosum]|nr:hypothetical protein ATCC90586_000953 [Pythium insidiosum]